ncbi:MAG: lysophospholipid acyltransferase family protein [Sphingomonadaceae bacterium]
MTVLRSLAFAILFLGGTVPMALLVAALAPFSREGLRRGAHLWAAWFVWCARVLAGVRLVVRGRVPQTPCLVAFKHQSAFETYLCLYLFNHPAVVMKAELLDIPVWGFIARRHGSIGLDRSRGTAAMKTLIREARDRIAQGRPILIFPEGTRVAPGTAPPLKPGLAGLYALLGLPVVPVALDSGACWPRGLVKHPGTVTLAFLPPVPPGLGREEMEARVHAGINADPVSARVEGTPA